MPRKGKGQKAKTVTGQQYGKAKKQREAQNVIPLPKGAAPAGSPSSPRPGQIPFIAPSARPSEPVTTAGSLQHQTGMVEEERRFRAAMLLPVLSEMASQPDASPHLRNSVRKLKAFVGDPSLFADRTP